MAEDPRTSSAAAPAVAGGADAHALVRDMPAAVAVIDADGRVLMASERMCAVIGRARRDVLGATPPYPWWPPEDRERMAAVHRRARGGGDGEHRFTWLRPDGRRVRVAASIAPLRGAGPAASVVVAREVAEPWDGAELSALAGSMDDGIAVVDLDGRLVHVSDRLCEMTGFRRDELVGRMPPFLPWPEELGAIAQTFPGVLASGEGVSDLVFRRASGERFPARVSVSAVAGDAGPTAYLAAVRDLSELAAARRERHEVEGALRAVAEASPALIYLADPGGAVTYASDAWTELTGMSQEQALGFGFLDALHPDDRERVLAELPAGDPAEGGWQVEVRLRGADGGWRWADVRGRPRFTADGEFAGWAGVAVDITDRVQAEARLQVRERMMAAVAEIEGLLLRQGATGGALAEATALLGRACGAGRAALWRVGEPPAGHLELVAEWAPPGAPPLAGEPLALRLTAADPPVAAVMGRLAQGLPARLSAGDLPPRWRAVAERLENRSAAAAPVGADGVLWGFLCLAHAAEGHVWSDPEIDVLVTVAAALGAVVARADAEAAARQQYARLRAAVDSSGDLVALFAAVHDPLGRLVDLQVLDVNPGVLAAAGGLRREELVGRRMLEVFPPLASTPLLDECRQVIATGTPLEREAVDALDPSGWRRIWYRVAPLGQGVALTLRDVTEERGREADEAALRRVALAVAEGRAPEQVFGLVADEARRLLAGDTGGVMRWDGAGGLDPVGVSGFDLPLGAPFPMAGGGTASAVMGGGGPRRVDDVEVSLGGVRLACGTVVMAPVTVQGRVWGAVAVSTNPGRRLPPGSEQRLARFCELIGLAVQNAEDRARLEHMAATDPLTGLANHRTFQERLATEVARAERHGRPLALALLDLDRFKELNDALGHAAGDRALAEVARRLSAAARPGDLLARVGGEEFAWILPETDADGARLACERARRAVAAGGGGDLPHITLSAGVCDLARARSGDALFGLADGALYWAKGHGRNRVIVYSPEVVQELSAAERVERLERARALIALRALARAVDAKDHHTLEHSERVAEWAALIAAELGWRESDVEALREAALLHDVGKIGVPDSALFTPGPPGPEAWRLIRGHATLGAEIASEALTPRQIAWVRHHHERWDGTGYPDGLRGRQIPEGAAILGLADAWDAMTTDRHYRAALGGGDALREVEACAGTQFAPRAAAALAAVAQRRQG